MATIRPDQLPASGAVSPSSAVIVDDGLDVKKATPLQVVDAGRPKATQLEAEAGVDNEKIVTPLRVSQAIDALGASRAEIDNLKPFTDLTAFKAQDVTNNNGAARLITVDGTIGYTWVPGSTGTPDDDNFIASTFVGAPAGNWEKQGAVTVRANDGSTVQDALNGFPADLPVGVSPAVLRTILLDAQVSRMLSASGDGDTSAPARTAETAKFQALLDTGRSFDIPQPDVTYAVNQLVMHNGQELRGYGRFGPNYDTQGGEFQFTGNGVDPTIVMGNGTGNPRRHALIGVSVINANAPAVDVDNAPDWVLDRCRVYSSGNTAALRANYSYVASVTNCSIAVGGPGVGSDTWAVDLTDNMNGFTAIGNRVTGGSGGGAFRIGQSYQIALIQNIIESSLHGIWIASDNNTGGGNCNGVTLHGNNHEQCSTPYKLGTVFSVFGLSMSGGYISNPATTNIAARTACIQLGRVRGGKIFGMSMHPHSSEDLFWLWLNNASGNMFDLEVGNNTVAGTPNAAYALKGTYAANASVKASEGGNNSFDFMGDGNPQGTNNIREFITPPLKASTSVSNLTWITNAVKALGGKLYSAEVIDYNGGTFGTASIRAGRTALTTENFSTALSALSFSGGVANIPVSVAAISSGSDNTYGLVSDGTATAEFRMRFRFRIN